MFKMHNDIVYQKKKRLKIKNEIRLQFHLQEHGVKSINLCASRTVNAVLTYIQCSMLGREERSSHSGSWVPAKNSNCGVLL